MEMFIVEGILVPFQVDLFQSRELKYLHFYLTSVDLLIRSD